jgi:hypothetical protein
MSMEARLGDGKHLPSVSRAHLKVSKKIPFSTIEAANRAEGQLYSILNQQSSLLSYFDCFVSLIVPGLAAVGVALLIKNFKPPGKPAESH